jgi:nicotinate-nucleotide adenylyltransferase
MTLAIFGGTFNPVHVGHLFLAEEVLDTLEYDLVLFVPALIPVHKDIVFEPGPEHRLAMLRLATAAHPRFRVDDCELARGGPSYTVDTVREVSDRYAPEGKPGLIIGDDLVAGFGSWKEAGRLAESTRLIVGHRNSAARVRMSYPCTYVENSLLPISSSQIRSRLREGRSVRHLVPEPVLDYITRHGLSRGWRVPCVADSGRTPCTARSQASVTIWRGSFRGSVCWLWPSRTAVPSPGRSASARFSCTGVPRRRSSKGRWGTAHRWSWRPWPTT